MDTREEMLNECDDIIQQLKRALNGVVDAKWGKDRKEFKVQKALVITLLQTLIKDVRGIGFKK